MPAFFFEWKDFRGGYYVGPSESTQPTNTWTGENVTVANDDAYLVPTYAPQTLTLSGSGTSGGVLSNGTTATEWSPATYCANYVILLSRTGTTAKIHFINTTTGAVTTGTITGTATTVENPPVIAYQGVDQLDAYFVIGDANIYYALFNSGSITSQGSVTPATAGVWTGATVWNARMIVWSKTSETFVFSEPLDFDNFPSLNFVGVGYNEDGIAHVVPRNLDVIIVKPSGWYSLTGVLGSSASIRQMNDTMGIVSTDPVAQHNNTVYFMTNTGFNDYSVNLMAIAGTRVDIAAYHRFGLFESNTKIIKTNMGYLGVVTTDVKNGGPIAKVYLLDVLDRWQMLQLENTSTSQQNTQYTLAKGQLARVGHPADQYLYLLETNNGNTYNTLKVIKLRPSTVEPGKLAASSAPSSGTVRLSDIDSKEPTMIRRVYVEAEMMQFPDGASPYSGTARIEVRVNNKSVDYLDFSTTIGDATSGYSTPYEFDFSDFVFITTDFVKQKRVLRFNVDNASYGYNNEVEIKFAGLRIRRVWVEGDSR